MASRRTAPLFAVAAIVALVPAAPAAGVSRTAAAASPGLAPVAAARPRAGDAIPGRVLVKFAPGAAAADRRAARRAVGAADRPGRRLTGDGIELLATDLAPDEAAARLAARRGVVFAEPDRYVSIDAAPNDPLFPSQWGLDDPGGFDIDALEAWSITTGSSNVVVAIVDSGIQLGHPDLDGNIWTNTDEIAGNGVDDDDNGFVDDVHGWDFWDGDALPNDGNGHGTHVAGIVAAEANNGIGVSGVAPGSRLMPVRMTGPDGFGSISAGAAAVDYAWRNGARIANLSWGYMGGVTQTLKDAIDIAGAHGMTVVAAAGNASADIDATPFQPAALPSTNLISVAATDDTGALADFSNSGAVGVDIGAPGVGIVSTWLSSGYASLDGTSMASPMVAGVAALALAANPSWTVTQLRVRLFQTVRPLPALAGRTATGGLINAHDALTGVSDKPPVVTITAPTAGSTALPGAPVTLQATATDAEDGDVGASLVWRSSIQGALGTGPSVTTSGLVRGQHVITASASDSGGHHPVRGIVFTVGPTITRIAASSDNSLPAIAVAADGTPTIAWLRYGTGAFAATRTAGGTWTPALISPSDDDRRVDVAIDSGGVPHVAIQRNWSSTSVYSDPGVMLATRSGGAWSTERATDSCTDFAQDGCSVDWDPHLVLDAAGAAHIATGRLGATFGGPVASPRVLHVWQTSTGAIASETIHLGNTPTNASLALGPTGALHAVWAERAGTTPGVWYATRASGSWVATRVSTAATDDSPSLAVDATGKVSISWIDTTGIRLRTRSGSSWTPALGSAGSLAVPGRFGAVDLAVGPDSALRLVAGRIDAGSVASGISYATNAGGTWAVTSLASGQSLWPSIAVDAAGHVHVAYEDAWPSPRIVYASNATGAWTTATVIASATYEAMDYAVDGRGVAQAVVGRFGSAPGLFLGTRSGSSWSLSRITSSTIPDGVGFATSSIGEGHLLYGTGSGIYYATNASGAWKATKLGAFLTTSDKSLVLDAGGKAHVAFVGTVGSQSGLFYATNRTGTWKTSRVTASDYIDPSLAIDSAGHARIAARTGSATAIAVFANASGSWTSTVIGSGGANFDPDIAVDEDGETSVAYSRDGEGIRLTEQRGSSWVTRLVQIGQVPAAPQLVIDSSGVRHILYGDATYNYAICSVPNCSAYPGMHEVVAGDTGGFTDHRVSYVGPDIPHALVRGRDGRLAGAFTRAGIGAYEVTLERPPTRTATAIDDLSPASVAGGGARTLSGRLHAGATNLAGKTLVFKVDGVTVGSAPTNASGIATIAWTPNVPAGSHTLTIGFAGGSGYLAARVGPRPLTVT